MMLIILASLPAKHPTVTEALQVLVNALTVHVGTGTDLSGKPTYQELSGTNWPQRVSNPPVKSASLTVLLYSILVSSSVLGQQRTGDPDKSVETRITALVTKSATFDGKRVRVFASFHTDGFERSVLMEPNCGQPGAAANERQCRRGVVPMESDKAEKDPGNHSLDRALAQGNRSTMDKHITAAFIGIFRCDPSCASPRQLTLEIERVENLRVEMKDLEPHPPK
jgi:hypothetical protein